MTVVGIRGWLSKATEDMQVLPADFLPNNGPIKQNSTGVLSSTSYRRISNTEETIQPFLRLQYENAVVAKCGKHVRDSMESSFAGTALW
jgi:hypothetical protein